MVTQKYFYSGKVVLAVAQGPDTYNVCGAQNLQLCSLLFVQTTKYLPVMRAYYNYFVVLFSDNSTVGKFVVPSAYR